MAIQSKKIVRSLSLVGLTLLLSFLTYRLAYFVAEKYFFDKFFYQKSIAHGYTFGPPKIDFSKYGQRGRDLLEIEKSAPRSPSVDRNHFVIDIIGDSHVWGQGIRNNQRFAKLLEDRLNKIYPTKIYSYGSPGNNTLQYLNDYMLILTRHRANLYIIVPVTNDAVLSQTNLTDMLTLTCQTQFPQIKPITVPTQDDQLKQVNDTYITNLIDNSWKNTVNTCIVDQSLKRLPTENAIYLIDKDYHRDNHQFDTYVSLMASNHKTIISTSIGQYMDRYSQYFNSDVYKNFIVSPSDPHPNALANQMYADILFAEITKNSKWGFVRYPPAK